MEQRIKLQSGQGQRKAKVERFDDDLKREGRGLNVVSGVCLLQGCELRPRGSKVVLARS